MDGPHKIKFKNSIVWFKNNNESNENIMGGNLKFKNYIWLTIWKNKIFNHLNNRDKKMREKI